ncbi:hypothetical protein C0J52_10823, partial [Blattella germanica]
KGAKGAEKGGGNKGGGEHKESGGHKSSEGHKSSHHHYSGKKGDQGKEKHVKETEEKGGKHDSHHDEDSHGKSHHEEDKGHHGRALSQINTARKESSQKDTSLQTTKDIRDIMDMKSNTAMTAVMPKRVITNNTKIKKV